MSKVCKAFGGNVGANAPQDCNWPFCNCDPAANKVIAAIEESGYEIVRKQDFANHPIGIAELRSEREGRASLWSGRDLLIHVLRLIDKNEIDPTKLVVMYERKEGEEYHTNHFAAGTMNYYEIYGFVMVILNQMLKD